MREPDPTTRSSPEQGGGLVRVRPDDGVEVLILRDPRESVKKCSLTPLQGSPGVAFATYHPDRRVEAGGRVLLDPEGEPFGPADHGRRLLLIDCAWRRVASLRRTVLGEPVRRRLPALVTAYPRRSSTFEDPARGLASVEALYAASLALGRPRPAWLAGYRWRDEFLERNAALLAELAAGRG